MDERKSRHLEDRKRGVDRHHRDVVPSVGVRAGAGAKDDSLEVLELPHFDTCVGCFASFRYGRVVDSCECIRYLRKKLDGKT